MRFEWDEAKAASNRHKHGVTFEEAKTVFADPLAFIEGDGVHPERLHILGLSARLRLLLVVYVEKEDHGDHQRTARDRA